MVVSCSDPCCPSNLRGSRLFQCAEAVPPRLSLRRFRYGRAVRREVRAPAWGYAENQIVKSLSKLITNSIERA